MGREKIGHVPRYMTFSDLVKPTYTPKLTSNHLISLVVLILRSK